MRTLRGLTTLCVGLVTFAFALQAGVARADDFSTERPGSILIFPKVVSAIDTDTLIEITNSSNMPTTVRCFYINGAPEDPMAPADPTYNPPLCQVIDFEITLTRQQPTSWLVSTGRWVDPADDMPGLDPGGVPPMPSVPYAFTGGLVCVEVDVSLGPIAGNSLRGAATVGSRLSNDVSKYNATTIEGLSPNADMDLRLDGVEYARCPDGLLLNFQREGGSDDVIDEFGDPNGVSEVTTSLALMPCSIDLENLVGGETTIQFDVRNEFEEPGSASTTIQCWQSVPLSASSIAGAFEGLGSPFGTARVYPADPNVDVGLVGVATTERGILGQGSGSAAVNMHFEGNNPSDPNGIDAVIRIRGM